MGNIINPSPGDLVDRQTILLVKLEHCGVEGDTGLQPVSSEVMEVSKEKTVARTVLMEKTEINIQPFILEANAIQEKLHLYWFYKLSDKQGEEFNTLFAKLKATNAGLWKLEDQARVLRMAPDKQSDTILHRKAETLDAITFNNDQRADLVRKINSLWNIDIQEKLYQ